MNVRRTPAVDMAGLAFGYCAAIMLVGGALTLFDNALKAIRFIITGG